MAQSKRCGCASDHCGCVVQGGPGVEVSGSGSPTNPYVVESVPASDLAVQDETTTVKSGATLLTFKGGGVTAAAGIGDEVVVTVPAPPVSIAGVVSAVQVFSASGTWTKPANLLYVTVEVQGAGGGSGGVAVTSASQVAASGAGGGGGYARKTILAATLGATEVVTVGVAGTAGATTPSAGGVGGLSSFGAHCSGSGGGGGMGGGAVSTGSSNNADGGSGGGATNGDLNINGGEGGIGTVVAGVFLLTAYGGISQLSNARRAGSNGTGWANLYGGGGSGSTNPANTTARTGTAGAGGVVIVTSVTKT